MRGINFLKSAFLLAISGLIVKIIGFVFRITLSNIIGAEGIGLIQIISPVYSLIILTITSGISIAVSKLISESNSRDKSFYIKYVIKYAVMITLVSGVIIAGSLYFSLDFITNSVIKDERTYLALLVFIPFIPIISVAAVYRGYFYGLQKVLPVAISQIVEQVVKITIILACVNYFFDLGLEYTCAIVLFGTAIGEGSNFLVLLFKKISEKKQKAKPISNVEKVSIIKNLAGISFPISINRFIMSVFSTAELILIPKMLLESGWDYKSSIEIFGRLTGMAFPIIMFPSFISSSVATMLVPALSKDISLGNLTLATKKISIAIKGSFVIGILFSFMFYFFSNEISDLFFKKQSIADLIKLLSLSTLFLYAQQVLLGIMNGLGMQATCLIISIIGCAVRIFCIYTLIPVLGINGYISGVTYSTILTIILSILYVSKKLKIDKNYVRGFFKLLIR